MRVTTQIASERLMSDARCPTPDARPAGFTLVELMVVTVIISIILGFILAAAMDARRRSEERATQSLITKLETGLNDRMDALLQTRPDYNTAHLALGAIYNSNATQPMAGHQRAQVIAMYDYLKSEMPDVFFVQSSSPFYQYYPLNFAGNPYPGTTIDQLGMGNFILPLGNSVAPPYGDGNVNNPAGTGIFGASYPVAAGLYKNLGYLPQGYDGADNNQNGYVDEMAEGAPTGTAAYAQVQANLSNHKHITARSEMLYALLVEGRGPLGSIFNADDFTDREVQDTDGDGLPEFVDAWGQPIQFFRWPLLYHSDLQRGQMMVSTSENSWSLSYPYATAFEQREQNPLDLNQQLVAPAWWSGSYNNAIASAIGSYPGSTGSQLNLSVNAQAFESFFHRLTEPDPNAGGLTYWDRGTTYGSRRAYYSKFLIVSSGLNQQLGVFLYSDAAISTLGANAAAALIANENLAMPFGWSPSGSGFVPDVDFTAHASYQISTIPVAPANPTSLDPNHPTSYDVIQGAQDDISNQNIQLTVAIGGSG